MSRDWQKDAELCSSVEGEQWINEGNQLEEYDRLTETGCRYIATFDREEDAAFTAEAREALPYWLQQYTAEKERADKAEEREKVLKHAFIVMLGYVPKTARVALDFDDVLSSLYPKEETK